MKVTRNFYTNGTHYVDYIKTDDMGVSMEIEIVYDEYFGLCSINGIKLDENTKKLLKNVIEGVMEDLKEIGVI